MSIRLTDSAIGRAAREAAETGKRRDLADAGQSGLRLRLTPAGGKSWVLACRDRSGRMRRFPLGAYPDRGISEARTEARALHTRVRQDGADPVAERRRDREIGRDARAGIGTLAAMLDQYTPQAPDSWPHSRLRVERVFRALLPLPVSAITLGELQRAAETYPTPASAAFAVRALRPALKWGARPARKLVPLELCQLMVPERSEAGRRRRVLARDELARLLPALRGSDRPHAAAMRLVLLTLLRRSEADGARWRDLDWQAGTLTIPAERSKNGEPHVVPLSRQAADLLRARLPDAAEPAGLIFATHAGTMLGNWDRATKSVMVASGTSGWHRHDLRRTGATMLGEMGETPDIIEAALNHISIRSALAATYNRSRYRPQVAAALQRLADALDAIEANAAG